MKQSTLHNDDIAHKAIVNYIKIYLIKKNDHLPRSEYKKLKKIIEVSRFLGLIPKSHLNLVI
jgi:hypothetical protein